MRPTHVPVSDRAVSLDAGARQFGQWPSSVLQLPAVSWAALLVALEGSETIPNRGLRGLPILVGLCADRQFHSRVPPNEVASEHAVQRSGPHLQ